MTDRALLIATDEAGYGPQLGPLVIASSTWHIDVSKDPADLFEPHSRGFQHPVLGKLAFNDSKQVYSPKKPGGLNRLEAAVVAAIALQHPAGVSTVSELIDLLHPGQAQRLSTIDWFSMDRLEMPIPHTIRIDSGWETLSKSFGDSLANNETTLISTAATVVPAGEFNELCERAGNKATLLSEQTVALVLRTLQDHAAGDVRVYSDKHGGRAFYGGLLQHFFPDWQVNVVEEGRLHSEYTLENNATRLQWHFTAKGDSFAPVALASMVAKYLRERLMQSFNAYWISKKAGLRPTAGYPGDAARFLRDIDDLLSDSKKQQLVRCR